MNDSELMNFLKDASEDSCIKLKINDIADTFIILKRGQILITVLCMLVFALLILQIFL